MIKGHGKMPIKLKGPGNPGGGRSCEAHLDWNWMESDLDARKTFRKAICDVVKGRQEVTCSVWSIHGGPAPFPNLNEVLELEGRPTP